MNIYTHVLSSWMNRSRKVQYSIALILAALSFIAVYGIAQALSYTQFEAESGTVTGSATKVADATASGGNMLQFNATTGGAKVFTHPGVVFTKAQIDSWTTSSPEYSRLAGTGAGSLTNTTARYTPVVFGTRIDSGGSADFRNPDNELNLGFKDQSGYAKVQALLWAADNNNARREKVIAYLSQYRTVTGFEWDSTEQYRLTSGWGCTNIVQAAEIINYQDDQFKRFLRDVCYPVMDWPGNPNWNASFADSKLAIAAYLGDEALWTDAKRYFHERIKQSIYHSKYDNGKVNPFHNEDNKSDVKDSAGNKIGTTVPARIHTVAGTPNLSITKLSWGSNWGTTQIRDDYSLNSSVGAIVDGINGERLRDFNHVTMSYVAWVNGARTIRAQGEQIEAQAYDRIAAGWNYHATRVLHYFQTGTFLAPAPVNGTGDSQYRTGFCAARTFLGSATPQSIKDALLRSEVRTYAPAGSNHMVGEPFSDCNSGF